MSDQNTTTITVAHGDGIGPEIMEATLKILEAAQARIDIETIEVGEKVYERGSSSGIEADAWQALRRNKIFLKAPITTPQGGGVKSLNVTIRKTLSLYANVRPVISLHPFVDTHHPELDVVVVRENEEDLYAAIEHRQTQEVTQCLKLITRPGTERLSRYAFEYARQFGRKKVTCFVKDNIMKITDGLFRRIFEEVAEDYPDIESGHKIIDIGTALVAERPEDFDVIVAPNLYGDILSDVVAQIAGSVGMAGSANIGDEIAMFEAVHGSAPDIAGQGIANPSGLLQASVMMLQHINQADVATTIQNAWLRTIEEGIHTGDIYRDGVSKTRVNTKEFTKAVIDRLGSSPERFEPVEYKGRQEVKVAKNKVVAKQDKKLVGVDVFADWDDEAERDAGALAELLRGADHPELNLVMITNRGVKVWPDGMPETFHTDHWRCRFQAEGGAPISPESLVDLLGRLVERGVDVIKTENLYTFDGERGFSLGQGQ